MLAFCHLDFVTRTRVRTTHEVYMIVFLDVQKLVRIDEAVSMMSQCHIDLHGHTGDVVIVIFLHGNI